LPSKQLKQKIKGSKFSIFGKTYPSKIIGLHNRFRAKTDKRLIYQDIRKLPGKVHQGVFGIYVPTQERHIIYLHRGAKDITVAHELIHAILYEEGYVAIYGRDEDQRKEPWIGILAHKIQDVVIHPIVFHQLQRFGFDVDQEEKQQSTSLLSAPQRKPVEPDNPYTQKYVLNLFGDAVSYVEAHFRYPSAREQLRHFYQKRFPEALKLGENIIELISWLPDRTPLKYRILIIRLINYLDQVAKNHQVTLSLPTRLLLPPFIIKSRLTDSAREFFSLRTVKEQEGDTPPVLALQFLSDKSYSRVWTFQREDEQRQATTQLHRQLDEMQVGRFLEFNRQKYFLIEKKGRKRCVVKRISF
jgi:hypothetical protein